MKIESAIKKLAKAGYTITQRQLVHVAPTEGLLYTATKSSGCSIEFLGSHGKVKCIRLVRTDSVGKATEDFFATAYCDNLTQAMYLYEHHTIRLMRKG